FIIPWQTIGGNIAYACGQGARAADLSIYIGGIEPAEIGVAGGCFHFYLFADIDGGAKVKDVLAVVAVIRDPLITRAGIGYTQGSYVAGAGEGHIMGGRVARAVKALEHIGIT